MQHDRIDVDQHSEPSSYSYIDRIIIALCSSHFGSNKDVATFFVLVGDADKDENIDLAQDVALRTRTTDAMTSFN